MIIKFKLNKYNVKCLVFSFQSDLMKSTVVDES